MAADYCFRSSWELLFQDRWFPNRFISVGKVSHDDRHSFVRFWTPNRIVRRTVPHETWLSASSLLLAGLTQPWHILEKYLLNDSCRVEVLYLNLKESSDAPVDVFDKLLGTLAEPACALTCLCLSIDSFNLRMAKRLSSFLLGSLQTSRLRYLRVDYDVPGDAVSEESCRVIAEALASPACPLLGLSLAVPHIKAAQHLEIALVDPQCNLRCLGLNAVGTFRNKWEWVNRLLRNPACQLLDLGLECEWGIPPLERLECGLKRLSIRSNKIPMLLPDFCGRLQELVLNGTFAPENLIIALESPRCELGVLSLQVRETTFSETAFASFCRAIVSEHCSIKCLEFFSDFPLQYTTHITDALRHKGCTLESLLLPETKLKGFLAENLVNALESNFKLCTLEVQLPSSFQARASNLLRRNQLLREGGLLLHPQVKPRSARLFLCGHERVGKTTTRNKIIHLVKKKWRNPRHKVQPTRGMELQAVTFGDKKLVLCDLAGHKEYHAFHHFFVAGSDRDLFLVVCKATDQPGQHEFSLKLRYWFRFIASHRTPEKARPKVIVVLNFFFSTSSGDVMTAIASERTRTLMEEYADVLDFGQQTDINVFGINALEIRDFSPIVDRLEVLLTELLDSRSLIPKICDDVGSILSLPGRNKFPVRKSKQKQLVLPLWLIATKYVQKFSKDNTENNGGAPLRAALVELHNAGEIVFFPSHDEQDDECQIVIVDCQWFCCNLIGILMKPEDIIDHGQRNLPAEPGVWRPEDIKQILLQQNCQPEYVPNVLGYLRRLGLFYQMDSSKLICPSLLPETDPQWQVCQVEAAIFGGRRFECGDKVKTLLPAGLFARLQVKLHAKYGNLSWKVGCGWISFLEDCVATIVRFGGESSRWEDRQWMDIMVRYPGPRERHDNRAEDIFHFVKKQMFSICKGIDRGIPVVSLRECVMGEGCVRALESGSKDVKSLDEIKEIVREKGIRYNLPWSDGSSTPILDSLLPGELRELVAEDFNALREIAEEFQTGDCVDVQESSETHPPLSEENRLLRQHMDERFDRIDRRFDRIDRSLKDISEGLSEIRNKMESLLQNIRHEERNILTSCSYQLVKDLLTGPLPAFPFITDKKGLWQPIKNLFGKEVQLHFMCEWYEGEHVVDGQGGLPVKITTPEWLVRAGPVLVPALKVACCTARLAATLVLPGTHVFVPSLSAFGLSSEQLQYKVLPDVLKIFVDQVPKLQGLKSRQPTVDPSRLRECLFDLTKGKHVDMERDFQLLRVEIPKEQRISWVCRDHARDLQRLKNQDPFQS